jgi:hypothetical protein
MATGSISFDDFLAQAQTGDLVLFHGVSTESTIVEAITGGPYSHATMVVVLPNGDKTLWQAAGEALEVDPVKGVLHTGAQLGALADTVTLLYHHWNDEPHYRPVVWDRPATLANDVLAFVQHLEGRPFPDTVVMLGNWLVGTNLDIDLARGSVFCSELVAMTYQALGLLPADPVPNSYCPSDFSSEYGHVPLQGGATFGDDLAIDLSTIPPQRTPPAPLATEG